MLYLFLWSVLVQNVAILNRNKGILNRNKGILTEIRELHLHACHMGMLQELVLVLLVVLSGHPAKSQKVTSHLPPSMTILVGMTILVRSKYKFKYKLQLLLCCIPNSIDIRR